MLAEIPSWLFTQEVFKADIPYFGAVEWSAPFPFLASFGTTALYLLCIFVIFPAIKPSKEKVEKIAYWHFVALCVYSFIAFAGTAYYMYSAGEFTNYEKFLCTPLPNWLRFLSITFTVSKIWEWLDTAIFIWRGQSLKKIGFLHLYHHATTVFLFLHVMNKPGTEKSGMLMNGFVHTLMYAHYAFRLPKMFRPIITAAQIVQLATSTTFWDHIRASCPAYTSFRDEHYFEYLIPYLFVPVYLAFFLKFFGEQYIWGTAKPAGSKKPAVAGTAAPAVEAKSPSKTKKID